MRISLKSFIYLYGIANIGALTITMLAVWWVAFFQPDHYSVIVGIDWFHERIPELILLIPGMPCIAIVLWDAGKSIIIRIVDEMKGVKYKS